MRLGRQVCLARFSLSLLLLRIQALKPETATALKEMVEVKKAGTGISKWDPAKLAKLSPAAAVALTTEQLGSLTPQQLEKLPPAVLAALDATQLAALKPAQLKALGAKQLAALKVLDLSNFTPDQLASLDPKVFCRGRLSAIQLAPFLCLLLIAPLLRNARAQRM